MAEWFETANAVTFTGKVAMTPSAFHGHGPGGREIRSMLDQETEDPPFSRTHTIHVPIVATGELGDRLLALPFGARVTISGRFVASTWLNRGQSLVVEITSLEVHTVPLLSLIRAQESGLSTISQQQEGACSTSVSKVNQ